VSANVLQPTALLDVKVLIALLDPRHVRHEVAHHEVAHHWFAAQAERPWASCAITQNAVLRILAHPRYTNSPGSPGVVSTVLRGLVAHPRHRFWETAPSLLDQRLITRAFSGGHEAQERIQG
jgi:predicted nucleic acid-binding protein